MMVKSKDTLVGNMFTHLYMGQKRWQSRLVRSAENQESRCNCKIQLSLCSWHQDHRQWHLRNTRQHLPKARYTNDTIKKTALCPTLDVCCRRLNLQLSICFKMPENIFHLKNMHSNTNTDVGLAGFFGWFSWLVTRFTCTGVSSRCVGANRIRTADSRVEALIDV